MGSDAKGLFANLLAKGWQPDGRGGWTAPSRRPMGALEADHPKLAREGARQDSQPGSGADRLGYRITFIQSRHRLLDKGDNANTALKPLRDVIAETLGFTNDDHPDLTWEYDQRKTDGVQGVLVMIEMVKVG